MKGYNILIVEDDRSISRNLKQILEDNGANVTLNETGQNVFEQVADNHLILMDIMLPVDDGLSISLDIKKRTNIPMIFLTARSDIDSKLKGLKSGEDYITKPFHPLELISRVDNLLGQYYSGQYVKLAHLLVDEKKAIVLDAQRNEILFTKTEQKLFFYLFKNINITLTKEKMMEHIWPDGETFDNILSVYIKKIRNKIADADGEIVRTMHGIGYRMINHDK